MTEERWLPVVGMEPFFEVSDRGRIRSVDYRDALGRLWHGRIMRPRVSRGYLVIMLRRGAVKRNAPVHRLVAEVFCARPEGTYEVNHKDLERTNNTALNLEWVTRRENAAHAHAAGRYRAATNPGRCRAITQQGVEQARALRAEGHTYQEIGRILGVHLSNVRRRCLGEEPRQYPARDPEVADKIVAMSRAGLTQKRIAASLQISTATVWATLNQRLSIK